MGETPLRPGLLRLLGDVAWLRGQYETAVAHYQTCLTDSQDNLAEQIKALNGLGQVRMTQGDNAEASALLEQGLALARQHQDQMLTSTLLVSLGQLAFQH
jgi:tetratricopeptide (TPR) repeat protein